MTPKTLLEPGDTFPTLTVHAAGGDDLVLPEALSGAFGVVLVTRGAWCPYCNAQLRAFQRAEESLSDVGARVVSLSVDDETSALQLAEKHGLTYPVGHSADADAVSEAVGSFVDRQRGFLQATGFVLDPQGKVLVSVYSSGAIGRLMPDDVVGMIKYARKQAESEA